MYRSCFASNIGKKGVLEYEVMRERMVIWTRPGRFTPILGNNGLEYGFWWFSIYLLLYYCTVHAYFPDESTV